MTLALSEYRYSQETIQMVEQFQQWLSGEMSLLDAVVDDGAVLTVPLVSRQKMVIEAFKDTLMRAVLLDILQQSSDETNQ